MKTLAVVIAAVLAAAGSASGQQPSSQPMSDREALAAEKQIASRLQQEPDLRNNRIDVQVENGVATLKGKVDSDVERSRAQDVAWVEGVTRVNDWLLVGRTANKRVSDSAVTSDIEARYRADKTLGRAHISVATDDGVVTLAGVIPSNSARQRAIEVAETSPGVKRVEDKLRAAGGGD